MKVPLLLKGVKSSGEIDWCVERTLPALNTGAGPKMTAKETEEYTWIEEKILDTDKRYFIEC